MATDQPQYAITFGRTDFFANEEGKDALQTIVSNSMEDVKSLARRFITVIPDDLDDYREEIDCWDGNSVLMLDHQDDDTFLFLATPIAMMTDRSNFNAFVAEFVVNSHEEDSGDSEEDDG